MTVTPEYYASYQKARREIPEPLWAGNEYAFDDYYQSLKPQSGLSPEVIYRLEKESVGRISDMEKYNAWQKAMTKWGSTEYSKLRQQYLYAKSFLNNIDAIRAYEQEMNGNAAWNGYTGQVKSGLGA